MKYGHSLVRYAVTIDDFFDGDNHTKQKETKQLNLNVCVCMCSFCLFVSWMCLRCIVCLRADGGHTSN